MKSQHPSGQNLAVLALVSLLLTALSVSSQSKLGVIAFKPYLFESAGNQKGAGGTWAAACPGETQQSERETDRISAGPFEKHLDESRTTNRLSGWRAGRVGDCAGARSTISHLHGDARIRGCHRVGSTGHG